MSEPKRLWVWYNSRHYRQADSIKPKSDVIQCSEYVLASEIESKDRLIRELVTALSRLDKHGHTDATWRLALKALASAKAKGFE